MSFCVDGAKITWACFNNSFTQYEEILQIGVNKVLEEDFIQGVRQTSENLGRKATTNMPSNKILFPELTRRHWNIKDND